MANSEIVNFSVVDYCVFLAALGASLGIGIYHCVRGNRTTDDFLLAGRSMSAAPIALSLTATLISSIAILGYTGEVYGHGIQSVWYVAGMVMGVLIATHVFIPVLFPLKLDSINEYLERRFRSTMVKRMVMLMTSVSSLLYLGVCLYAPTLALESVTPIKSEVYIVLLGLIVTAYSSFGGMKAVVWTDAFQAIFLILGVIMALISATVAAGGPAQVWRTASEHGRADALDIRLGLFVRHTALNTMLKNTVTFTAQYAFHQTTVQRLATLKSLQMARVVLYLNMLGVASILILLYMGGMSLFAVYAGCDPISRGYITRKDQILPYFVMDYLGFLKGIPGLFVACLLCGTMSSISSFLNSLPTMLWKDFVSELAYFRTASERSRTICTKIMTFLLGLVMIGLAFSASKMGGLVQANATLLGVLAGPNMGIFFLGICVPFCNKKGAVAGALSAVSFMAWLGISMQLYASQPELLPLSTNQCRPSDNTTSSVPSTELINSEFTSFSPNEFNANSSDSPLVGLYSISYTFLPVIGATACIVVGIAVSLVTGRENTEEIAPELILPCLRRFLRRAPASHVSEVKRFLSPKKTVAEKKHPQHLNLGISLNVKEAKIKL